VVEGGERAKIKLVIDASVAVKWIIPGGPGEDEAKTLKNEIVLGGLEAYAPELIIYELASAISKAVKNIALEIQDGIEALRAVNSLGINLAEKARDAVLKEPEQSILGVLNVEVLRNAF